MKQLDVKALAIAAGISWASYMLLIGWLAAMFGFGTSFVEMISSMYIGFTPTFLGGIIGAIWGFVDGAIGGAIIAFVYNIVNKNK